MQSGRTSMTHHSMFTGSASTRLGSFTGIASSDIVSICSGGRVRMSNSDAASALIPEVEEDEVFENERYIPIAGFKSSHLLMSDPYRYAPIYLGNLISH